MSPAEKALAVFARDERRQVLATLVRVCGSLGIAEDALQDAMVRALETWTAEGPPPNPAAWLTVAAKHRAIDLLRRDLARTGKEAEAVNLATLLGDDDDDQDAHPVTDDQLRLLFICCHPALSAPTQLALALRHLCGLEVTEVARALLTTEATMAKRLTRARTKIADAGIPYRVPGGAELPGRLRGVLATIYLLFNEGYSASAGASHLRSELVDESVRLARLVVQLMPDEVSATSLLALLLLQDARRPARLDPGGDVVLLRDQDRSLWQRHRVGEGVALLTDALRRSNGIAHPYTVQAAIAACHDLAPSWDETDWHAIHEWYDVLVAVDDSPVARLNRAVAIAEEGDPRKALDEMSELDRLQGYAPWHAAQGEVLLRLDRPLEARAAFQRALALGGTDATARHLRTRLAAIEG